MPNNDLNIDEAFARLFPTDAYNEPIPDRTRYVDLFGLVLDFNQTIVFSPQHKKYLKKSYPTKETPQIARLWTRFMRKPIRENWKAWADAVAEHHKVEAAQFLKPSVARANQERNQDAIITLKEWEKANKEEAPKPPKLIIPSEVPQGDPLIEAARSLLRERVRKSGVTDDELP